MLNENSNIKRQINRLEQEKVGLRKIDSQVNTPRPNSEVGDAMQIKQMNTQLQKRIEFLQKREKDLMEHLLKFQKVKN